MSKKALLLEADLLLDRASLLHRKQWSGQVQRAKCFLLKRAKTCSKAFLLDWCAPCRIFNKRKHVLPKAALLYWSAPGLTVPLSLLLLHRAHVQGKSALAQRAWAGHRWATRHCATKIYIMKEMIISIYSNHK